MFYMNIEIVQPETEIVVVLYWDREVEPTLFHCKLFSHNENVWNC